MIMKNILFLCTVMMLCSAMIFAQPSQKLTGLIIESTNPQSDPMKLVNEQAELPNSPSIPTSIPTDGWNTWFADTVEMNLGGTFTVTHIYLFDGWGNPPFGIDYLDANGNWQVINNMTLNATTEWVTALSNGNITTSKLRFRKTDASTSVFEIAVYGYQGDCPPEGTACDDGNPNTENDRYDSNCNCVGTPISTDSCLADKDAGGNPANIAALDARYNKPSPHTFRNMMGVNDTGLFQGIEDTENPISYLTPNLRVFHAMDYDYDPDLSTKVNNWNSIPGQSQPFPYDQVKKPKVTNGIPDKISNSRTNYTNYRGPQGMANISAATEIIQKGNMTWKEKIWQETDWYPNTPSITPVSEGIRIAYKNYTRSFIQEFAPNSGSQIISSYEVGNELWDYPITADYHAMLEGAYEACVEQYGNNTANWKMKLLPGSFNAASTMNTCPSKQRDFSNCTTDSGSRTYYQMGSYLDVNNCDVLSSFHAVNTHAYPLDHDGRYVHPEQAGNEFLTFKASIAFRDANDILADKPVWLTETGYDTGTASCNEREADGVGELSQAAMLLRIFMMTSRYHLARVNFYTSFDDGWEAGNIAYGCRYVSSGFWKLGTHPLYGYASAQPAHGAMPKPSFFAFRDFLERFNDKVFTKAVTENNDLYAYILANPDGTDAYLVFWSPTATDDGNVNVSRNINRTISLPNNYKLTTTSATPFAIDGNFNAPYTPTTPGTFAAANSTNTNSPTITQVRTMPSYIRLTTGIITPTCEDGIQNQGETGVDCGGPCPPCEGECTTPQPIILLAANASQSSDHPDIPSATADKAIDGNTTGAWNQISLTKWGFNEWWQVDLGRSYDIDQVALWNVTTGNQGIMNNVYVFISDSPFTSDDFTNTKNNPNVDDYLISGQLGRPSTVNANSTGRYIRVQREGQGFITLDEVRVSGCLAGDCTVGATCDDGNPNTENDKYNSDCECVGTPINSGTCSAVNVTVSGNTIRINNLYNEHQIIKIYNESWSQLLAECNSYNGIDVCQPSYSYTAPSAGTYQVQVLINGSQGEACNETETVQIGNGNKFAQLNDSQRLLIFPNPIKNNHPTLVLDSPEDEQLDIQIYNINSQLIYIQQASTVSGLNEITLDLQNARLASGVYFVKVISEKYTYGATRFVKP